MVTNSFYERSTLSNGSYGHMGGRGGGGGASPRGLVLATAPPGPDQHQQAQPQYHHVKSSKSMDLVADESNVASLAEHKSDLSPALPLGPTLGLKKSSSLESLQTAISEVRKNELLPFHRPRPHMVRGRGCNESFRAAIDKSYDGPAEDDDDDLSEQSSGRDTPASGSSRQETEEGKKDKKKKDKGKKKDKTKGKEKERGKKRAEEGEEPDKKTKKKGFGLLRFGKKKAEVKAEVKAGLQRQRSEVLSEEELERMKEERERIEAKHSELRDRQARGRGPPPDVEDDDGDPNYARINNFRDHQSPPRSPYPARTPSPQRPPASAHALHPAPEEALDGLYAKVNKQRAPPHPAPVSPDSVDRIQLLRREYQQARREGAAPAYEELEARRRGPEYDPHRQVPVRAPDHRLTPRYEEVERQYASLPRRGPMEPDYPMQPWAGHRDPGPYPGPHPGPQPSPAYPSYPRQAEQGYYHPPPPQQRGPLRQDVPPSPTMPHRAPRYDTMTRGVRAPYGPPSSEHYAYAPDGRHPDPRQKNPMTAAV
ncbi:partitioning defective 3 homolog B isoform X2 [Osmerus mordax]|uniref:partitioning defective 3 homolog B isoform X2 n=1 Tax=Osmerus mordax TaxID=8014 RepID=UPI00350F2017